MGPTVNPPQGFNPTSTTPIDEPDFKPTSTQAIEEPEKNPMDFTGDETPEEAEVKANVGAGEVAASVGTGLVAAVPSWADYIARSAIHGVGALIGYSVAGGDPQKSAQITNWLAKKHEEDKDSYDDIMNFWTYHPRTEQAQAILAMPQQAIHAGLQATLPDNAAQTVEEAGGGLLRALPPLSPKGTVVGLTRAVKAARAADAAKAAETAAAAAPRAPAVAPGAHAVTADQLRQGENPIPPPNDSKPLAPATAAVQPEQAPMVPQNEAERAVEGKTAPQEAPGAANATPPATETTPLGQRPGLAGQRGSARLFHPPQEDGPQFAAKNSDADVQARKQTLGELNALGGQLMTHDRQGAVTGDWSATGTEHENAKIPDAPGQIMRDQIASEHQTLHNAADAQYEATGAQAGNNIDRDTLEAGGRTVRAAVHAIEDHFTNAANGAYQTFRATMGDKPIMNMPRVQQILADSSHDVNPTSASLRNAAQARLKQLWTVGDTRGDVRTAPGTVGAAERFHEFLNEAHHNDSASLIRKLKNATDMDVAEAAGGNGAAETARALIKHREQMLEPDGVNQLRRPKDRNRIDHEVGLHDVLPHVTNLDSEHFEHFMNVLKAGAHLSPDVAEKSAAAIREIQGHMVASAHKAARGDGGAWNAKGFHSALNRYSTNMPAAFKANPQILSNMQTINRGGNILKMDKSYPGAVAQAARVGLLPNLAAKGIKALGTVGTLGGAAHGNVLLAGASHLGQKILEKGAEGMITRARSKAVQESLIPRNPKERGSVQIFRENNASGESAASQEAINRVEQERAQGRNRYQIDPDGNVTPLHGVDAVDARAPAGHVIVRTGTGVPGAPYEVMDRGGLAGRGAYGLVARAQKNIQAAEAEAHAARLQGRGGAALEAPRPTPYGGIGNPFERGSVRVMNESRGGNPYETAKPQEDVWKGVRPVNERMPNTEGRTGNPYDSGGARTLGNIVFGGKQRGSVGVAPKRTAGNFGGRGSEEEIHATMGTSYPEPSTAMPPPFQGGLQAGHDVNAPMGQTAPFRRQAGYATVLNIGHKVGDELKLDKKTVASALAKVGAKVGSHDVIEPHEGAPNLFERTSVVGLKKELTEAQGQALAKQLGQKAIAQRTGPGEGNMFVQPSAAKEAAEQGWDKYNPDYFHEANGMSESHNMTSFNPEELGGIHPNSTVKNPQRSAFPGIYDHPSDIMNRVQTAPEDPIMKELFGVTRKDLHDLALKRGEVAPQSIPKVNTGPRAKGSAVAKNTLTPENAERVRNIISAFKEHDLSAYHGMVGWYMMDPLHKMVQKVLGTKGKAADAAYSRLNTMMGMASPSSDVMTEINRGTGAHMMAAQGKFDQFKRFGGQAENERGRKFPPELENVKGHAYHSTAHSKPMEKYLETGEGSGGPKVSMYIGASENPRNPGFQNKVLVGDAHFVRGWGLPDVRPLKSVKGEMKVSGGSVTGPELQDLHPFYHEHVAKPLGLPSTSAQAVQWGALSKETGVETPVGAPKLELFAQQVKVAAERNGITPHEQLVRIIKGIAHAG